MLTYLKLGALAAVAAAFVWLFLSRADAVVEAAEAKQALSDYRAEVNAQALARMEENNRDAMVRARNNERIADAQDKRDAAVAASIARVQLANRGLRDTIAELERRPLPEDPGARALAHQASTARGLLQQCSERYQWLDGEAKKLGSQVTGLQEYAATVCGAQP